MNNFIFIKININKFLKFINIVAVAMLLFVTPITAEASYNSLSKESIEFISKIQNAKVTVDLRNETFGKILHEICKQGAIKYTFAAGVELETEKKYNLTVKSVSVEDALKQLFKNSPYTYTIEGNLIKIDKKIVRAQTKQEKKTRPITGKVIDENGNLVVGATVLIKDTSNGAITDDNGVFTLNLYDGLTLEVSFAGLKPISRVITAKDSNITITMEIDETEMDDVIVTSYFERKTNTFTGAATVLKGDDLRRVSTTNLFQALQVLDPAIQVQVSNEQGSNPNNIPEIIIRGTTSVNVNNERGVNDPLIVIDGIESSLTALYDMDIFDIETVITLKDASATALYGERAANGVILVTRKLERNQKIRLSYNMTGEFSFPDLTAYDLMDGREKLLFEKEAGLYDDPTGQLYNEFLRKMNMVNAGIDTHWISKPLRTGFSHNHSIGLSGSGSGLDYRVTARIKDTQGVMKEDKRQNYGLGFNLSYNYKGKFIASFNTNYTVTDELDSKYGRFSDYVSTNPYDAPYDEQGELVKMLSHNKDNPLYEATLASFDKGKQTELMTSLNLRWNIRPQFYISATGTLNTSDRDDDIYTSPLSNEFRSTTEPLDKGRYEVTSSEKLEYSGRILANYSKTLDKEGSLITLSAGGEIGKNSTIPDGYTTIGFFNDNLTNPGFGLKYPTTKSMNLYNSENSRVAFTSAMNLSFRNRYFMDASYRLSGSSLFGTSNPYAPFWSVGLGWNLHNEKWLKDNNAINILRLRGSYGHTGSLNFSSYQAITTFKYDQEYITPLGMGARPITIGNSDLKAQTTKSLNIGVNSTLLDNRLDINFDYYDRITDDLILPLSTPLSSGTERITANIGKQQNVGFEFNVSGKVIDTKELMWRVSFNGSHNKNTLLEIGETLKRDNEENLSSGGSGVMYIEGKSTTTLYRVRSAGIDPITGQEILITKDNKYTFDYNSRDMVDVGDTQAFLVGSISSYLNYKNFSLTLNMQYSQGGDVYNSTRQQRVEGLTAQNNGDRRAFTERWKEVGDIAQYVKIGESTGYPTSRFVERESYLSLTNLSVGYQFEREMISKIGLRTLYVSLSTRDLFYFSTVKRERGTFYPFARGFSFNISTSF